MTYLIRQTLGLSFPKLVDDGAFFLTLELRLGEVFDPPLTT